MNSFLAGELERSGEQPGSRCGSTPQGWDEHETVVNSFWEVLGYALFVSIYCKNPKGANNPVETIVTTFQNHFSFDHTA